MKVKQISLNKEKIIFFTLFILVPTILLFGLPRLLFPLVFAYIISLMLRPVVLSFYSKSIRQKLLSWIGLGFILFSVFYPVVKGVNTLTNETTKLQYYIPKLDSYLRKKYERLKFVVKEKYDYEISINPIDRVIEMGERSTKNLFTYIPSFVGSILEWGFLTPLFLFFIIKDGRSFREKMLKIVPNSIVERTYYLIYQFNRKFGDYIFAKFVEATIVGVTITVGLAIIDFPFAFLLGCAAAVTNIIPYIGPLLGFLPALCIGIIDQNPEYTIGTMSALYIIANIIDLSFVFPLLVSKIVNLHPILVVVSVIIGSQFAGVIGMVISIPLAAFFKLLFQEIYREVYRESNSGLD